MVDAGDLKSSVLTGVPVRVRQGPPLREDGEMADTGDSKSPAHRELAGSSPALPTKTIDIDMRPQRERRELSLHNLLAKNSPFSWRSLFAFVTITATSTVLLSLDKLASNDWIQLMQWLGGFFITGEAARKFAPKKDEEKLESQE